MKNRKILRILCAFVLLLTIATGCQRTYDFALAQSKDNAEKVEICRYDDNSQSTTTIAVLNKADADSLLAEIDAMECSRYFGDGTMDYGEVVIYVTYADQTAEVIGLHNVAKVDKDGDWHIGVEYFNAQQLCDVITKYVDAELLPDLSKYYD